LTGRIMSMKNSSDIIGNRTRDLTVCSAVPEPTAPPRTPHAPIVLPFFRIQSFSLFYKRLKEMRQFCWKQGDCNGCVWLRKFMVTKVTVPRSIQCTPL
jgi:hypothetical protein